MLSWEKFKDMSLEDAISCILRSQSRENSGVFNRQWRLLGLLVPMSYDINVLPRPKLSQAQARIARKENKNYTDSTYSC